MGIISKDLVKDSCRSDGSDYFSVLVRYNISPHEPLAAVPKSSLRLKESFPMNDKGGTDTFGNYENLFERH